MAEGEEEAGEEGESEEEETKKRSGEMEYDEEGNLIICHLNDKRRVTISEFKGKKLVSIREYYEKNGKQLPSNKGLNSKAKSRLSSKKRREPQVEPIVSQEEGLTTPVDMSTSLFVEKSVEGQSCSKRPQIEPVGFDDGGNITVVFSKAACSYSDPLSIEGHVESLFHPRDEARPIEISHFEASNYLVSESYEALQAAIFLCRDHAALDKKARTLSSVNTALRAENHRLVAAEQEVRAQMSEEVACLKAELGAKYAALAVKDAEIAAKDAELELEAEKKKCGELFETISVITSKWNVDGEIEVYKELLREETDGEDGVPRTDEYEEANPLVESIEVGVYQSGLVVEPMKGKNMRSRL